MRKIYYLLILLVGLSVLHSCKRMSGDDGSLLNNLGENQGGLNGARALFREMTDSDTLEYHYGGLKLIDVTTDSTITKIVYNSDLINQIKFDGYIDKKDSVSSSQFYTYDAAGKITMISETASKYYKGTPAQAVKKYKALYTLAYKTTGELATITSKFGQEVTGSTFLFTQYSIKNFTFSGLNVAKMSEDVGVISSSGVFGPSLHQTNYLYSEYDAKKSPYILLPLGYNIHQLLVNNLVGFSAAQLSGSNKNSYRISANSPKKVSITTEVLITPTIFGTQYSYDIQDYVLTGFGLTYIYKPF